MQAPQHEAQSPPSIKHWSTPAALPSSALASQVECTSDPVFVVPDDSVIEHVSSPSPPYDVGEMRSESRPHALNASRVSTSSPRLGEHFFRAFQTLISHVDAVRLVARNRDGVIAFTSLRRRGEEIRVTAVRSQRVPSINFLSAAGRALPEPRLPDTGFARRSSTHRRP